MPNKDSEFFGAINEATAARREIAEKEEKKQAALEYMKQWKKAERVETCSAKTFIAEKTDKTTITIGLEEYESNK